MGQTSIPVQEEVRDEIAEGKPDTMSWSEFLLRLYHDGTIEQPDTEYDRKILDRVEKTLELVELLPKETADELEERLR